MVNMSAKFDKEIHNGFSLFRVHKLISIYRIAGNFRWVLIFAISRTGYGVAKIKNAIIYSNRNSKVGSFKIAKIKIVKIISHTFTLKSRKFSSAKISRYTVCPLDLDLCPLISKINRVHPLTMANMSIKFDQEAHNGLVAIMFTSLFPYMSIVTLTFDLSPPKSIESILSTLLTCLPSLIKKNTTV